MNHRPPTVAKWSKLLCVVSSLRKLFEVAELTAELEAKPAIIEARSVRSTLEPFHYVVSSFPVQNRPFPQPANC